MEPVPAVLYNGGEISIEDCHLKEEDLEDICGSKSENLEEGAQSIRKQIMP